MRRAAVYGWGVVAPRSPDIDSFAENLQGSESWLQPFEGFGPNNFLVGQPSFDFEAYRQWVIERFKPNRFSQLESKMGEPVKYAIGSFIQALGQNPGLEQELQGLGTRCHICIGTGLGDFDTQYRRSLDLYRCRRRWDRFWANPDHNSARRAFESGSPLASDALHGAPAVEPDQIPPSPHDADQDTRDAMEDEWWAFWARHSPELHQYLAEQRDIESVAVKGDVEQGKLSALKEKQRSLRRLHKKWGAPDPPWQAVNADILWNIDNIAAAQISMLGGITGATFAVGAACATFGLTLKMALDAIRRGEADAVVIGATDPAPHALTLGGFYNARVISADAQVSKPLTQLRGTHVSGGAAVWIVGARDHFDALGFKPLGLEPVSVGVTSDADHIITPSKEGPSMAMRLALDGASGETKAASGQGQAATDPDAADLGAADPNAGVVSWDLHATATPGDYNEVELLREVLPDSVLVTARKGTFGHGMSASGGWELTAQYLGYERGKLFPTPLNRGELNDEIASVHDNFVFDAGCPAPAGKVGKLSMGVGGVNSCVISRPLDAQPEGHDTDD